MASKHGESSNKNRSVSIKTILLIIIILGILAFLISFLFKDVIKIGNDEIEGTWTTDGVTVYEFNGRGKGTMKLPNSEYEFSYILHNNQIYIDFESDKAKDSDYEYSFENDKLVLKGIKATTGIYTFTKE